MFCSPCLPGILTPPSALHVDSFDGRLGRNGHLRVRGSLPITPALLDRSCIQVRPWTPFSVMVWTRGEVFLLQFIIAFLHSSFFCQIEADGLDLRVRNMYSGAVHGRVKVR